MKTIYYVLIAALAIMTASAVMAEDSSQEPKVVVSMEGTTALSDEDLEAWLLGEKVYDGKSVGMTEEEMRQVGGEPYRPEYESPMHDMLEEAARWRPIYHPPIIHHCPTNLPHCPR